MSVILGTKEKDGAIIQTVLRDDGKIETRADFHSSPMKWKGATVGIGGVEVKCESVICKTRHRVVRVEGEE